MSDLRRRPGRRFSSICQGIEIQYAYDGQSALFHVFRALRRHGRRYVLLPAFHCPTVVEPAIRAGLEPRFYLVNEDLSIDSEAISSELDQKTAAVVVISYFGFPGDLGSLQAHCAESGVALIEDCAHSFLSANPVGLTGDRGDFAIYSFKKVVPTFVGGGVRCNSDVFPMTVRLRRAPINESLKNAIRLFDEMVTNTKNQHIKSLRRGVSALKQLFRSSAGSKNDPEISRESSEFDYPYQQRLVDSRVSWSAMQILRRYSLEHAVDSRRRNYRVIQSRLQETARIKSCLAPMGSRVCPWGFPVVVQGRARHDHKLEELGVPLFTFGETLHPRLTKGAAADAQTIDVARYLSSSLLCFSIHQGISGDRQVAITDTINGYFS